MNNRCFDFAQHDKSQWSLSSRTVVRGLVSTTKEKTMEKINNFSLISPFELTENLFNSLDNDWMLVTAGDEQKFNTMTASWGGFGILWNKPVAFIFIRPQRYTFEFSEKNSHLTLSFYEEQYREALNFCGAKSGRDFDKVKETGLTPIRTDSGIAFEEARLIIECEKLYADFLKADQFIDKGIMQKNYPNSDFHRMYIAEIKSVYRKG